MKVNCKFIVIENRLKSVTYKNLLHIKDRRVKLVIKIILIYRKL